MFVCFFLETGYLYVAVAVLELIMYTRLALNPQIFTCFCNPNAEIKGVRTLARPVILLLFGNSCEAYAYAVFNIFIFQLFFSQ